MLSSVFVIGYKVFTEFTYNEGDRSLQFKTTLIIKICSDFGQTQPIFYFNFCLLMY